MRLYHGSKVKGLTVLKPSPHPAVHSRAVVFATTDIRFALAMIYGTGDELAVGYVVNQSTGEEEMYIDELQEGSASLLDTAGYVYEVAATGFFQEPQLSHVEYIKEGEGKVISVTVIENILQELDAVYGIRVTRYRDVPAAMESRGLSIANPKKPHADDRFPDYGKKFPRTP